jgi:hypothetical protein
MRRPKTSIALSCFSVAICAALTVLGLSFGTFAGYFLAAMFLGIGAYEAYRLHRKLWLYNRGRPLSAEKKKKLEQYRSQMRDHQRYNLHHVWYRFADATEHEYLAEKAKRTMKRLKRK